MDYSSLLRKLPQVNIIVSALESDESLRGVPRSLMLASSREILSGIRSSILEFSNSTEADPVSKDTLLKLVETESVVFAARELALRMNASSFRKVINATGIIVHTNLGRAPLSKESIESINETCSGYSNLEYDLNKGERGSRNDLIEEILKEITGAEAALVVNNNAAAVLLALSTFAAGKEVIVSRGQLVEIGGSFRLPDVMKQSGAILKEVGTTNKTYLKDYEEAVCENTSMIIRAHPSNYQIVGFTSEVSLVELVKLSTEKGLVLLDDLGSGLLLDLSEYGLPAEASVSQSVDSACDLVAFSGDKLLGGPQSGIVLGKSDFINKMRSNPLARALRVDKMTIAALESTLSAYRDPKKALEKIPVLRMLTETEESVRRRALSIKKRLLGELDGASGLKINVMQESAYSGGGSFPMQSIPTYAVVITPDDEAVVSKTEAALRALPLPVLCRVRENSILLDARTVHADEVRIIAESAAASIKKALKTCEQA